MSARTLTTPRLLLRQWRDEDAEPFAAMSADPEVMRFFPKLLTPEESDGLMENQGLLLELRGWGLWAVEVVGGAPFVGFVGLAEPQFEARFTPCVEVGWRLAREHWGHGYATEAARAAVAFGFDELALDEIVALTTPANVRSRRVMEKLGMTRAPADDFEHPLVPVGHQIRPHVLYRLSRARPSGR